MVSRCSVALGKGRPAIHLALQARPSFKAPCLNQLTAPGTLLLVYNSLVFCCLSAKTAHPSSPEYMQSLPIAEVLVAGLAMPESDVQGQASQHHQEKTGQAVHAA